MMKICLGIVLSFSTVATAQTGEKPEGSARPRVSTAAIDPEEVRVLRVHPGYATSLRMPEEISSVVIGNPSDFKAEHSESEPKLVFIKPITKEPAESNALITTKSGHTVSLQLISPGTSAGDATVDFIVEYRRSRSFLVEETDESSLVVADSKDLLSEARDVAGTNGYGMDARLATEKHIARPDWQGRELLTAIGEVSEEHNQMRVPFSVFNDSKRWIELLPPQIQLDSGGVHGKRTKAEPVAIADYQMTARRLAPGARADGVVIFERPAFKESGERLMLQLSEAEQVDRPILLPLPFVVATGGGRQ
ncbi:MAG TPA: hypothetical protein VK699_01185 [Terriglobales bacterium]|jgi:hypothetical protein|nr:hypothetical protein [Terriglobales bacterium]